MTLNRLIFRVHARKRMYERGISEEDVRQALTSGEEIWTYPEDKPYPSRLVLGWCEGRPVHIVCADVEYIGTTIVITVYEPDPEQWEADFKTRKKR